VRTETGNQLHPGARRQCTRWCNGHRWERDVGQRSGRERMIGVKERYAATEVNPSTHMIGRIGVHASHKQPDSFSPCRHRLAPGAASVGKVWAKFDTHLTRTRNR